MRVMLDTNELVYTPREQNYDFFHIRDIDDYPVLYSAIIEDKVYLYGSYAKGIQRENSDVDRRLLGLRCPVPPPASCPPP